MRLAIRAQHASSLHPDVHKLPIFLVLIQRARRGIVRHVDVRPAVIVEVRSQHAERKRSVSLRDSCTLRNIAEGTVTVIVIQNVLATDKPGRSASHHHAFIEARARLGHGRSGQIQIDVVGNE